MREALFFYAADEGVAPDSSALGAWTKEGTGSVTFVEDGVRLQSTASRHRYLQQLVSSDGPGGPQRGTDLIEVQAYMRGQDDAGFTVTESGLGLVIYDGLRGYMLSIGASLQWLAPDTGAVVKVIKENWDWGSGHAYRMRKEHAGRVEIWIDGTLYDAVPPRAFPALDTDAPSPARAGFGIHAEATCDVVFDQVEVTLNRATPPHWKVLRYYMDLFVKVKDAWTAEARALLRSMIGLVQTGLDMMTAEFRDRTAEDLPIVAHSFTGARLPSEEDEAWSFTEDDPTVVREQLLFGDTARGFTVPSVGERGPDPVEEDAWLSGPLESPFYDHTVAPGGEASIGPSSIPAGGHNIRGILIARSTLVSAHDTTQLAFSGDTSASDYDFAYINPTSDGFPDNYRGWSWINGDTVDNLWSIIEFSIQCYDSSFLKHSMQVRVCGGPKGAQEEFAMGANRQHVQAVFNALAIECTGGGMWDEGTRMIMWLD